MQRRVAACQILTSHEPAESADKIIRWMHRAADEGVDVVAFPEAAVCGYAAGAEYWQHADPRAFAEAEAQVAAEAARLNLAVVLGTAHWADGAGPFNSLLLIDDDGRCLSNYRRTHAQPEDGALALGHGQWLSAMPLGRWRLGLLSGHDLAHPEPARALRLVGCDLLLVAGAATMPAATETFLRARAAENRCHLAFASATPDLPPEVLGPDGMPLVRMAGPSALAVADLPERPPAHDSALLQSRRPRLYHRLVALEPGEAEGAA
jgi:predicted amidohydrolase